MKYWIIALVLVVLAAVAWYLYQQDTAETPEPDVPVPALAEPAVEAMPQAATPPVTEPVAPAPMLEPEPVVEEPQLPALGESDPEVLEALQGLAGPDYPVTAYVVEEDVISRAVATVDALGGKQVPGSIQVVQGPGGEFQATDDQQPDNVIRNDLGDVIPQYRLDPANYARYTPYVDMLDAMEPDAIVATYRSWEPLFEEAFGQLGYPDADFTDRLRSLIDELLATPEPQGPVRLIKPEAYYLFADEDLESLTAGQKILLRMGPENAARVKARLREIRAALAAP